MHTYKDIFKMYTDEQERMEKKVKMIVMIQIRNMRTCALRKAQSNAVNHLF